MGDREMYDPAFCDGEPCIVDCEHCPIAQKIMEANADAADRAALAVILVKNGYSVRFVRVKDKSSYKHYLEYWKEGAA